MDGEQILIRESVAGDDDAFRECFDAVAQERTFLALVEAPPLADVERFLADARAGGLVQFLAFSGEVVVGWCDVSRHSREGYRHSGSLGIGVRAEYRRRGLGRRLLRATLAAARQRGLRRIELDVHASNQAAIALYVSEGFRKEGLKRAARVRAGRTPASSGDHRRARITSRARGRRADRPGVSGRGSGRRPAGFGSNRPAVGSRAAPGLS